MAFFKQPANNFFKYAFQTACRFYGWAGGGINGSGRLKVSDGFFNRFAKSFFKHIIFKHIFQTGSIFSTHSSGGFPLLRGGSGGVNGLGRLKFSDGLCQAALSNIVSSAL